MREIIERTYQAQAELRNAKDKRDWIADELSAANQAAARAGAPISTQDWMNDARYRDAVENVERYARTVAVCQDAAGGVVYRLPLANLGGALVKLEALKKRAAKLGHTISFNADPADIETVENEHTGTVRRYQYVTLAADPVKLAGWAFLAKLSIEEAGVIISKVPAYARAWAVRRETGDTVSSIELLEEAAKTTLDAFNLTAWADEKTASNCEHCGLSRRRTATYLVENLTNGEVKQVGSNCLRDFLGTDPHQILKYASYLNDAVAIFDDDDEGGSGGGKLEISVEHFLTHVCAMIRLHGWSARSTGFEPTADRASQNIWAQIDKSTDKRGQKLWDDPTDDDAKRASEALAWGREHFGEKRANGTANDFEHNMAVACTGTVVTDRTEGTLAYLPVAHARHLEREIELAREREQHAASEHFGTIGARTELTLTVARVFEVEGHYGTTFITTLHDQTGNEFKWFGSHELERGATYTGRWTIKAHEEWKGTKQTVVTRPAKLEVVEDVQTAIEVAVA